MEYLTPKSPLDINWRSIILFGKNVASYKFALAQSLIELSSQGKSLVTLDELAAPFSRYIINHLKTADKQGTSSSSKYLDACRKFINGAINQSDLIQKTVELGFVNVIDAFHNVNGGEIPIRFYLDERKLSDSIRLTDNLFVLSETFQFVNLPYETEARWRLVETAWSLSIPTNSLIIKFDPLDQNLFIEERRIRQNVTACRHALNGYQKGKCFYCFADISVDGNNNTFGEVDHFFPNTLKNICISDQINFDGVWNLVLSCRECNRGAKGKFAQIPESKFLERLHNRNNFLINSNHPLRETLINQTGLTDQDRLEYLKQIDKLAIQYLIHKWKPENELPGSF